MIPSRASLQQALVFWSCALGLLLLVLLPLTMLAGQLFGPGVAGRIAATLAEGRLWELLAATVGLALGVTVLALLVGVPLGVLFGKTDLPGRWLALLIHMFPVFVPPFLLALGWFQLFGTRGYLGTPITARLLFGPGGAIVVMGLAFAPIVTALTVLGLGGSDPSYEEAARASARPARVVMRISLPLAWPAIALAALLVFALAISEIGVPLFLRVNTYPAAVFSRLGGVSYSPGEAFALVLPLLGIALMLLFLERRLIGRRSFAALGLRDRQQQRLSLGRYRAPLGVAAWLLVVLPLAPLAVLFVSAGRPGFASLMDWLGSSLSVSLFSALGAAALITVLGLVIGHALARRMRAAGFLDAVAMLAFIMPAAVLGVGMIDAWNRPATHFVYSGMAILVIGLGARYAIVGIRALAAVLSRSSPAFEESAAAFGGGYLRRMLHIVVPMHARGLAGAFLLALVFCLRDLDTVVVFYPPGGATLPVRIFTLEANGPPPTVAALAGVQVALTAVVLMLGAILLLGRRRS